jgi:hypothetical protein
VKKRQGREILQVKIHPEQQEQLEQLERTHLAQEQARVSGPA